MPPAALTGSSLGAPGAPCAAAGAVCPVRPLPSMGPSARGLRRQHFCQAPASCRLLHSPSDISCLIPFAHCPLHLRPRCTLPFPPKSYLAPGPSPLKRGPGRFGGTQDSSSGLAGNAGTWLVESRLSVEREAHLCVSPASGRLRWRPPLAAASPASARGRDGKLIPTAATSRWEGSDERCSIGCLEKSVMSSPLMVDQLFPPLGGPWDPGA